MPARPGSPTPYNTTQRPLDRALAGAGLSPAEAIIMEVARELSYGLAKMQGLDDPLPFRLNLTELARAWELTRENASRGLARLKRARILTEADGALRINKRYREWKAPHKLTASVIALADAAHEPAAMFGYVPRAQQMLPINGWIGQLDCAEFLTGPCRIGHAHRDDVVTRAVTDPSRAPCRIRHGSAIPPCTPPIRKGIKELCEGGEPHTQRSPPRPDQEDAAALDPFRPQPTTPPPPDRKEPDQ